MGDWASGGFLLNGETDGIQTTVLLTFGGNSNIPFHLGRSFGLEVVYHFVVM